MSNHKKNVGNPEDDGRRGRALGQRAIDGVASESSTEIPKQSPPEAHDPHLQEHLEEHFDDKDVRLIEDMSAIGGLELPKSDGIVAQDLVDVVPGLEDSDHENIRSAPRWTRLLKRVAPGLAVAGGLGVLEMVRQRFQHAQTFVPDQYPNGIWDPSPYGVQAEDVWFSRGDGPELHGWWIPCKRARGTILYCHGNSGNITNRIGVYRYMQRLKVNVLAFDYRGYGRSEGKPSEDGLYEDARTAHDYLTDTIDEDARRIVAFGHSLGGAVAIDLACQRPLAGLIAQSTFTSAREMARVRFPTVPMHWVASNHFRSLEKITTLEGLPKLVIHGTGDETIPYELGERLFDAAAGPKEWYSVPRAGHNDVYRFGGFRYLWKVSRFVRSCLKS